jgi:integrase
MFYVKDRITGKAESLGTADRGQAQHLLAARNQAAIQPQLNRAMARTYLMAKSPELATRIWAEVMDHYAQNGVASTRERTERAFVSRPFAMLRTLALLETEAIHLLAVLEHRQAGNSTHHYLRRIHNYALHLGWLLAPVMAEAAWPTIRSKKFTAITEEEHLRIVDREQNVERRLYYEMLWQTGGSQTDIAHLNWSRIDLRNHTIQFVGKKLEGRGDNGASCLHIGRCVEALLKEVPQVGDLFPRVRLELPEHRAGEFKRRCRTLKIEGRTLHSYRYAWAQRARVAGMPEREAMNHLGHKSRAIHAAYAGGARERINLPFLLFQRDGKRVLSFGLIITPEPVDGLFFTGDFLPHRNRFQVDRDLMIEERKGGEPVDDAGIGFLRPTLDRKERVVVAVQIKGRFVLQADAVAVPAKFLNRQLRLKQILEIDFEPVGERGIEEPFIIGEVLQIGHGASCRACAKNRRERDAQFVEVGTKLVEGLVVVVEQADFALHETRRIFDVLGDKKNQLFPSQGSIHHPLPIAGKSFLPDGSDILVCGQPRRW